MRNPNINKESSVGLVEETNAKPALSKTNFVCGFLAAASRFSDTQFNSKGLLFLVFDRRQSHILHKLNNSKRQSG
jgi:hypothetical protein